MSFKKQATFKNVKATSKISSMELIMIDKDIKEAEEKLEKLMIKRDLMYEKISAKEKIENYFY
jgi:hypothetical protein